MSPPVCIRVLGPLEVVVDGEVIDAGTAKQRLLLALLVANIGREVLVETVVDCLWPEDPPARPRASVQAYVSRLRSILGSRSSGRTGRDVLARSTCGYRLPLEELTVDSVRFAELVAAAYRELEDGGPGLARALCDEALVLWRGPALADGGDREMFVAERARLEELRWRAVELRAAAELALGEHSAAIADLQRSVLEAPQREQLRVHLATALFRAGRQVDALAVVRDGIAQLREAFGLDPSETLRGLERDLLQHAGHLQGSPRVAGLEAQRFPAPSGELFGRQAELSAMLAASGDASAGRGRCLLISGQAGIGKTELLAVLAKRLRRQGWMVGWARCPEGGDVPGLWPMREIDEQLVRVDGGRHLEASDANLGNLGQLDAAGSGSARVAGSAGSLFAASTALVRLLRRVGELRPVLVVIDDLHWADSATLGLLRHLVNDLHGVRAVLALAHRDDGENADLIAVRADAIRGHTAVSITLGGLVVDDVARLVARESGHDPAQEAVDRIVSRTGGNPFFVKQLASAAPGQLPAEVQDVTRRRLQSLTDEDRRVVEAIAVASERADIQLVGAAIGMPPTRVVTALDRAARAGLVRERSGRVSFTHDVTREAVYEGLSAAVRAELHQRIATTLELRWGLIPTVLPALAWHLSRGAIREDPEHALEVVTLAARTAERSGSFHEGAQRWGWAHDLISVANAGPRQRFVVALGLGRTRLRVGALTAGRRALLEAALVAEQADDWNGIVDALAATRGLSVWPWHEPAVDAERERLLTLAISKLDRDDHTRRGLALTQLAFELYHGDDDRQCDELSAQGCELTRSSGDTRAHALALNARWIAMKRFQHADLQLQLAEEMATLEGTASAFPGEIAAVASAMAAPARLSLGDVDGVARELAGAAKIAADGRSPFLSVQLRWWSLTKALIEGDTARAESLLTDAIAFQDRVGVSDASVKGTLVLIAIRLEQGRSKEIVDMVRAAPQLLVGERRPYTELLVMALLDIGAREQAATLAASLGPDSTPRDFSWAALMCAKAHNRARLGDRTACSILHDELSPFAKRLAFFGGQDPPVFGAVAHFLGELALALDQPSLATEHLERAVARNDRLRARSWTARSWAALGVARRRAGDRDGSTSAFNIARQIAGALGSKILREQVEARCAGHATVGW